MIICHCKAVSDRSIRRAVRNGACDETLIARECEAGSGCGGCLPAIHEIIDRELGTSREARDVQSDLSLS